MLNKILKNKVTFVEATVNTRLHDGRVIRWPDVSNDKFKKFLPHLGPTLFNKLPSELRNIDNTVEFKNKVKTHYKNNC